MLRVFARVFTRGCDDDGGGGRRKLRGRTHLASPPRGSSTPRIEGEPTMCRPPLSLSVSTIRERRKEERRARRRDNNSQKYASCRRPYRGSASSNNLELCTCITWRSAAASCVTKSIPFESRVFSPSSSPDLLSLRMEMEKFEEFSIQGS